MTPPKKSLSKHTGPMSREHLFQTMEYLGYPTGEATVKTVDALFQRQVVEDSQLVPQIATEYKKHDPMYRR